MITHIYIDKNRRIKKVKNKELARLTRKRIKNFYNVFAYKYKLVETYGEETVFRVVLKRVAPCVLEEGYVWHV